MTESPSHPRRRAGRPRSAASRDAENLSEREIVEAAMRIVRTDGIDKLTMRRLSRELGVSAMAPYYYVADKEGLFDLVASEALKGISAPDKSVGPWSVQLRQLIDQVEERLHANPGVGEIVLAQILRGQRHIIAAVMGILFDAGFDERTVVVAYSMIHSYLFGRNQASRADVPAAIDVDLPPEIARAVRGLDQLRGHDYYEFGIDTLIAGLHVQLSRLQGADAERPGFTPGQTSR